MEGADLQGTDPLQKTFFKGPADAHHFAGGLHLCRKRIVGIRKFIKRKTRELGHHVIQCRLEGSRGIGDLDLIQCHAHSDLCGNAGDRVAAGFRCQCRRPRYTRIYFDQIVLERVRIQRELHIAAALDLHMVFLVRQRLGRADDNGIAGMDPDRIQVFHITDGDGGVIMIPHHFIFDLFKAFDALFNQDLVHRGKL